MKTLPPGQHVSAEDFNKAVARSPGWAATRVLEDAEVPIDGGRWLYRTLAEGKLGLDMYNMREALAKAGLVYVDELNED